MILRCANFLLMSLFSRVTKKLNSRFCWQKYFKLHFGSKGNDLCGKKSLERIVTCILISAGSRTVTNTDKTISPKNLFSGPQLNVQDESSTTTETGGEPQHSSPEIVDLGMQKPNSIFTRFECQCQIITHVYV